MSINRDITDDPVKQSIIQRDRDKVARWVDEFQEAVSKRAEEMKQKNIFYRRFVNNHICDFVEISNNSVGQIDIENTPEFIRLVDYIVEMGLFWDIHASDNCGSPRISLRVDFG